MLSAAQCEAVISYKATLPETLHWWQNYCSGMCWGGGCCFCTAPYIGHHNDAALPVTSLTTTQHQACGAHIRAEPLLMQIPQTRFCNIFASRPRDALLRTAGGRVEAELGQGSRGLTVSGV